MFLLQPKLNLGHILNKAQNTNGPNWTNSTIKFELKIGLEHFLNDLKNTTC